METLFDQYKELNINGSLICLEQVEDIYSYFCYPTNAKAIGFEGSMRSIWRRWGTGKICFPAPAM